MIDTPDGKVTKTVVSRSISRCRGRSVLHPPGDGQVVLAGAEAEFIPVGTAMALMGTASLLLTVVLTPALNRPLRTVSRRELGSPGR